MRTLFATKGDVNGHGDGGAVEATLDDRLVPSWFSTFALVGVCVVGVALRLWSPSKLWLDEALSVNISRLSLGDLFEALRHDGHPPLYYVLLHYWMAIFGEGDIAVRALSGVISIATLPLAWVAGRRLAGPVGARWTLAMVALSPFCIRYASETRMYALVMFLVLAGYLLVDDALKVPTARRLAGVAVISGLLLLSHYWSIWLLAAVGSLLLWRWWHLGRLAQQAAETPGDDLLPSDPDADTLPSDPTDADGSALDPAGDGSVREPGADGVLSGAAAGGVLSGAGADGSGVAGERRATLLVAVAMAAGGVLFLPWLPSFLYQSSHTGTPWGKPFRPTTAVVTTLADMAGGLNFFDGYLLATMLVVLCLVALFGVRAVGNEVVLDFRSTPLVRRELAVASLTLAIGTLTAFATAATFQSRYAAVFVPLVLVSAAAGIAVLPEKARLVAGGLTLALSLLGAGWTLYYERTQAGEIASAVAARAEPGDFVIYCPDQLGPDFSREMPDGLVEMAYPTLGSPERVDWVDYSDRQASADVLELAAEVRRQSAGHSIFLVWQPDYRTFGTQCQDFLSGLTESRASETLVYSNSDRYYEPAFLTWIHP